MRVGSRRKNSHGLICRLPSLLAGMPTATKRPPRRSILRPRSKPASLAENTRHASTPPKDWSALGRLVGAEHGVRAERLDERQPLFADVDADDLVAEGTGDLHRVVAEPTGRADHCDSPTGEDVVLEQLLDRAVGGEAAAGQGGLLVADIVGQLDQ